ncbi:uncharacterized protein METZ01_LOCUS515735, partial [marine metagenome]
MREMQFAWMVFAVVSCNDAVPDTGRHRELHTIAGETMGTTYTVKVVSTEDEFDLARTRSTIEKRLAQINARMSH